MIDNIATIILDAPATNHYYIVRTEGKPVVLGVALREALQRFPKSSLSLTHSPKLRAIAEGVEASGNLEFLRDKHCDLIQGDLFSPPLPIDKFYELLVEGMALECLEGTFATSGS